MWKPFLIIYIPIQIRIKIYHNRIWFFYMFINEYIRTYVNLVELYRQPLFAHTFQNERNPKRQTDTRVMFPNFVCFFLFGVVSSGESKTKLLTNVKFHLLPKTHSPKVFVFRKEEIVVLCGTCSKKGKCYRQ